MRALRRDAHVPQPHGALAGGPPQGPPPLALAAVLLNARGCAVRVGQIGLRVQVLTGIQGGCGEDAGACDLVPQLQCSIHMWRACNLVMMIFSILSTQLPMT